MGPLGEIPLVGPLLLLLAEVSTPIKVGWALFAVWGVAQIIWRRRALITVPPLAPVRAVVRKPSTVVRRPAGPSTLRGGSPEFLAALGLQEPTPVRHGDR